MLDLNRLRYFKAVAETGSFTAAARRLGLAQPTLSVQVARLEEELGTRVLTRRRDGVSLTEAGRRLLDLASGLLDRAHEIEASMRAEGREPSGVLRIACVNSVGIYLLPEILDLLHRRHPKIRPDIRFEHADVVVELLADGEVDLALTASPGAPAAPHHLLLTDDPLLLACGRGHALWGRRIVKPHDLQGESLIGFDAATPTAKLVDRALSRRKIRMSPVIRASQIAAIVRMVEMNLGLGFLPRMAIAQEIAGGRLHAIEFAVEELHRGIWVGWTAEQPFPALDAFLACAQAASPAGAAR